MCGKSDFTYDIESDEFTLGHHIFDDHLLNDELDFDASYTVAILIFVVLNSLMLNNTSLFIFQILSPLWFFGTYQGFHSIRCRIPY